MKNEDRFIFVLSIPSGQGTDRLIGYLEAAGVSVDHDYGAVQLNAEKTKYALRGVASREVIEELQRKGQLEILPDSELER
jgi:hypothetical protein